jgi:hypothetical protein
LVVGFRFSNAPSAARLASRHAAASPAWIHARHAPWYAPRNEPRHEPWYEPWHAYWWSYGWSDGTNAASANASLVLIPQFVIFYFFLETIYTLAVFQSSTYQRFSPLNAKLLDIYNDIHIASLICFVDSNLHVGVRDGLDFGALLVLVEIKCLSRADKK